ncbi:phospho-sugar mutase [Kribbella sp. NPDC058693]|uniref:phospho-sugar mutase n=1 Tax=Kribbella sp. NPDC058693 TaxID=3346602 RepID=UPI00365845EB
MTQDLKAAADAWLSEDPDPDTRAELQALLDAGDTTELADRFAGTLEFGTAGLRGAVGAGPNRMNRVVVIRAAAGLAAYLKAKGLTDGPVLIGYDARHKSDVFAQDTAAVIRGAGLDAVLLDRPTPTPVVAFGIRHLRAVAGVVVTASHNPPQDNGYKVYLGDGSQIVPPADAEIAAAIAAVGPLAEVPRGDHWQTTGDDLLNAYLDRIADLVPADAPRELKVAYTPLHGVGRTLVEAAVARAGFAVPQVVASQADPDPDFPTVSFPNPEEPGAIDAALELARSMDADIAVANDPDADRCAVAIPVDESGTWRMLRGDELGALLGEFLLAPGPTGVAACSIVSSSLLGKIAASYGVRYVETLTGFKWIGRVPDLVFGYEEALGYCVDPAAVKDKDGVSTLVRVLQLAAQAKAAGRTLQDLLDDLAVKHGLHATDQLAVRVDDLSLIAQAMERLRATPPATLGDYTVERIDDLSQGSETLPPTDGLRYTLSDGARVVVRPSGTEPKLKCYLEVVVPVSTDVASARRRAGEDLSGIKQTLSTALGL